MRRSSLTYLSGYPDEVCRQAQRLIDEGRLGAYLLAKYPSPHQVRTDRALYDYVIGLKNTFLRTSSPLSRVVYDGSITLLHDALGLHTFVSRVQGGRLKAKNEVRIASVFREAPLEFLRMIVVHELAHLNEREHSKSFYRLCEHMQPEYHQVELDARLYLTCLDVKGPLYGAGAGTACPAAC